MKQGKSLLTLLAQNPDRVDDYIDLFQLGRPTRGLEIPSEISLDGALAACRRAPLDSDSANDDMTVSPQLCGEMSADEAGRTCQQYAHTPRAIS